jgi:hypothetical protein
MKDSLEIVPLFAAIPEALITLLIFAGYAIVNAIFKKKNAGEDGTPGGEAPPSRTSRPRENPQPPPARPPAPTINWEEELRRMLGEEPSVAPPRPSPVVVPPPPPPARPRTVSRPILAPPPVTARSGDDEEDTGLKVPMPSLTDSARAYERASQLDDKMQTRMRQRRTMSEATNSYEQASRLDVRVAEHMRQVTEGVSAFTAAPRMPRRSQTAESAGAMVKSREGLRLAIIASVVLGPPKALES